MIKDAQRPLGEVMTSLEDRTVDLASYALW